MQEEYYRNVIQTSKGEKKLYSMRKLREGLLASKRVDEFTVKVYEDCVDECLNQGNFQELIKSLTRLIKLYGELQCCERSEEMKGYLILYLYCFNNSPSVYIITRQIEKFGVDASSTCVKFILSLDNFDYYRSAQCWSIMSENEKIIARTCFPRVRPSLLARLVKSFYSLPLNQIRVMLLIEATDEDEEYLKDILPFGIGKKEICELKRRSSSGVFIPF